VFAQESATTTATPTPEAEVVDTESLSGTSTATSSEESLLVTEAAEADEKQWYKSERIFGRIDVGDFVVGPGRSEVELAPGETAVIEITVTNRITEDREFRLEVEDVTGSLDPSVSVANLGPDEIGPDSVQDYISFPDDSFILELGERARVPVTISVPPDAEPGGYYGAVLVSTVRLSENADGSRPAQPIIARVGSLVFLTITGDIERSGETKEVTLVDDKWWYESGPVDIGILFENTGSVHLNPYGEVSVTNMFGEEVGFVELEPWFVLPQSLRLREITWDREFLLGRYTITAQINRGYDDVIDTVSVSFWVLPWKIVGGVFFVLFIIIFGIRAFFRTFEFKRKGS
jgi:hypothetical protein